MGKKKNKKNNGDFLHEFACDGLECVLLANARGETYQVDKPWELMRIQMALMASRGIDKRFKKILKSLEAIDNALAEVKIDIKGDGNIDDMNITLFKDEEQDELNGMAPDIEDAYDPNEDNSVPDGCTCGECDCDKKKDKKVTEFKPKKKKVAEDAEFESQYLIDKACGDCKVDRLGQNFMYVISVYDVLKQEFDLDSEIAVYSERDGIMDAIRGAIAYVNETDGSHTRSLPRSLTQLSKNSKAYEDFKAVYGNEAYLTKSGIATKGILEVLADALIGIEASRRVLEEILVELDKLDSPDREDDKLYNLHWLRDMLGVDI